MTFCLEIKGDYACFTRPEMKVERVSYDVITPSSVRSVFEAILWKPAISWQVDKIEVLKPIRWVNLRRNEVASVIPTGNIKKAMNGGELPSLYVDEDRQQRAGLFLRDVAYRIYADFSLTQQAGSGESYTKFSEMFKRRASKGQCINQPYLGCREFSCAFRLIEDPDTEPAPIESSAQLGWMLYDMDFNSNSPTPMFFNAVMEEGIINIPHRDSQEVRR
ncbi:type I-C CRISPR-associated protein Cas5c [Lacimicrobium alkaliphilum]|uniref:pre-crRNA processing endonuclease n=1 Tax=Lacimicrobium alkaliphilum TaxID=1526571 RepID=A0ABQ1RFK7_9ALTE|nr:type I-C CRISPR-associated protein Cas5c [Lacimicrobium alkaliphilum]GGD66763.1 type I-C CRISPR-associated protein Cas5 [Lacimicrobium alkaliphilum]